MMYEPKLEHIDVEITKRCNLACIHCSARSNTKGMELSLNKVKAVLDSARSLGLKEIGFTGGEPLMHRAKMVALLKYCKESLKVKIHVHTNGTLLETKDAAILADLVDEMTIPILGSKPQTHDHITSVKGSLKGAEKALRTLLDQSANVKVFLVPLKPNFREIPSIVIKVHKMGCHRFRVLSLSPTGRSRNDFASLSLDFDEVEWLTKQLLKAQAELGVSIDAGFCTRQDFPQLGSLEGHQPCLAAENRVHIDAFGGVFPCTAASGIQQFSAGNLRKCKYDLPSIWKFSPMLQFLRYFHSNPPNQCRTCQAYKQCMGGCRVMMQYKHGDMTATKSGCRFPE